MPIPSTQLKQDTLVVATYNFAQHGGAVGDIILPVAVPPNFVVERGFIWVETAPTSGGSATIAVRVQTANDIKAATAIGTFTANAIIDIVPVATAATMVRTTTERQVTLTIATAALTAGKFHIYMRGVTL